jgi:predicted DNA-binding protein
MNQENRYFINWIKDKIDKNFMFINHTEMEESDLINKELNALKLDDVHELNSFVEKYLTEQQIKAMKAAYRKMLSRRKNSATRTVDSLELSEDHSFRLKELAKYTKSNKREYIKNIIDTNYQEMLDKKENIREGAYSKLSLILDENTQIHHKMIDIFPFSYFSDLHMLIWLKTDNKQLENYSPEEFLRKPGGLIKVFAALDRITKEDYDDSKIDWISL